MSLTPMYRPPIKRSRRPNLTRDQKRDIKSAASWGVSTLEMMKRWPQLSRQQIQRVLDTPTTPKKPSGRPPVLGPNERAILIDFVCQSKRHRRMTYVELAKEFKHFGWGYMAIEAALQKEGFNRRWAMRKPPISEKNRLLRLQFARQHQHWTFRDWCKFLWSDETWVKYRRHCKT